MCGGDPPRERSQLEIESYDAYASHLRLQLRSPRYVLPNSTNPSNLISSIQTTVYCSSGRRAFWDKIPRAHGGCLGMGSRRRARQAAISPGEAQTAFDPGIPEWGNPGGVVPTCPGAERIGPGEATGGTETSKYPEERKSTETPGVAASETGPSPNPRERRASRALPRGGRGAWEPGAWGPRAE